MVVLFIISSRKKPGYICIDAEQNDFDILKKYHPSKICFECMVIIILCSWSNLKDQDIVRFVEDVSVYTIIIVLG